MSALHKINIWTIPCFVVLHPGNPIHLINRIIYHDPTQIALNYISLGLIISLPRSLTFAGVLVVPYSWNWKKIMNSVNSLFSKYRIVLNKQTLIDNFPELCPVCLSMFLNNLWGLPGRGPVLIFPPTSILWAVLCRFMTYNPNVHVTISGCNTMKQFRRSQYFYCIHRPCIFCRWRKKTKQNNIQRVLCVSKVTKSR